MHHGGAGTTHSASLCGRPSIVIPFMDEQLFWACTLEKLGLAPKPLAAKKANAKQLAARITTILTDQHYQKNAGKTASIISATQGVEKAVSLIQSTYNNN